jgi:hypothetical protein
MQQRFSSQAAADYERRTERPVSAPTRRINHAEGWRRILMVFVLAGIGGYLGWSFMRGDWGPDRYPSGPANHSGVVPYGWPQRGDRGGRYIDRQNCRPYGRHMLCDAIHDGPPPGETWRSRR